MSNDKVRLNVDMEQEAYDAFKALSKRQGITMAKNLRRVVYEELERDKIENAPIEMKKDTPAPASAFTMDQIDKALDVFKLVLNQQQ